jgi:hypothetical protein
VHLQAFLSISITQKCQILSCVTLVANERYVAVHCDLQQLNRTTNYFFTVCDRGWFIAPTLRYTAVRQWSVMVLYRITDLWPVSGCPL